MSLAITTTASKPSGGSESLQRVQRAESRPSDDLDAFLGYYQSASVLSTIDAAVSAVPCSRETNQVQRSEAAQLYSSDRVSFRKRHGYGVASSATEIVPRVPDLGKPELSDEAAAAEARCADEISAVIQEFFPPAEVYQFADELIAEQMESREVAAAVSDWRACMAKAGYVGLDSPATANVIVESYYNDLVMQYRKNLDVPNYAEVRIVLSQAEQAQLRDFEQSVFKVDSVCLDSTLARKALTKAYDQVLANVQLKFPDYPGFGQRAAELSARR